MELAGLLAERVLGRIMGGCSLWDFSIRCVLDNVNGVSEENGASGIKKAGCCFQQYKRQVRLQSASMLRTA